MKEDAKWNYTYFLVNACKKRLIALSFLPMISTIRRLARAIYLGADSARSFEVFDDDIFVVSYPKSGNTWVRFLVANLLYNDEETSFSNIEHRVPDIYRHTNRYLKKMTRPRILKSHEYFNPRYKKIIYIVRDPRDISISYYCYLKKVREIDEGMSLSVFVDEFVQGRVDEYGSWGQHVGSWLWELGSNANVLALKYEELKSAGGKEVEKIANFLGLISKPEEIAHAIEASSFERMRELEDQEPNFLEKSGNKRTRNDIAFVRQGKAGGWKGVLEPSDRERIESAWPSLMKEFGYLD